MLLLTRKPDQKILINQGSIEIKVMRVMGDIVTLGVSAPQHVDIDREEIFIQKNEHRQLFKRIA